MLNKIVCWQKWLAQSFDILSQNTILHLPPESAPLYNGTNRILSKFCSHSPFRALYFNYYNSNQRMHTVLLKSQKQISTPAVCIRWFDCNNYVLFLSVVAVISFIFFKTSDIYFNTTVSNPSHHHGPNATEFLSLFPSSGI